MLFENAPAIATVYVWSFRENVHSPSGPLLTTDIFPKTSNVQNFKTFFIVPTMVCLKNKLECKSYITIGINISKFWSLLENVQIG